MTAPSNPIMVAKASASASDVMVLVRTRLLSVFRQTALDDLDAYRQFYTNSNVAAVTTMPDRQLATMSDEQVCEWMSDIDDGCYCLVSGDLRSFEIVC